MVKIVDAYLKQSGILRVLDKRIQVQGLDGFALSCCANLIAEARRSRVWMICPTEETAKLAFDDMMLQEGSRAIYLPTDGQAFYSQYEKSRRTYEQVKALSAMQTDPRAAVVASLRAFCGRLPQASGIKSATLNLRVGGSFDPQKASQSLALSGYFNTSSVSIEGDFSSKGEVFDIFVMGEDYPIRIHTAWETIESISLFDPLNQATIKTLGHYDVALVNDEGDDRLSMITDYLGKDDYFIFVGDMRLSTSFKSLQAEAKSAYRKAYLEDKDASLPSTMLIDFTDLVEQAGASLLVRDIVDEKAEAYRFKIDGPRSYFGDVTLFKDELGHLLDEGWTVCVCSSSQPQLDRIRQILKDYENPRLTYMAQCPSSGFAIAQSRFLLICDFEILGRRKQVVKTLQHTQSSPLDSFVDLNPGDYIVHVNYGIGRFVKIDRLRSRDYIKIEYANDETLFVPIEQANYVQRYIGSNGNAPKLDTLGGKGWENKKAKARKSAEDLAAQLISLYARRQNSKGYAFEKDNEWQVRFEAAFPFQETEDQISCIQDIKEDMEKPQVMDRLVCGDVGYGKTEIAFRAAFKAVLSGKQVAFLAPTTILSEQHYKNFLKRSEGFPLNVGLLSRMIAPKDQKKTIKDLLDGKIDILFGTHRIIQKDIKFKDLGLLVVDEEQRFGVKDKERIKELKTNVDCLSLSATPIPRTLYMSLLKIRDMSLLTTAPISRKPIQTMIEEFSLDEVEKAIRMELDRGGQVFYLHNRIENLDDIVAFIQRRVPQAIVESAHGQMEPKVLEDTMTRFIHEGINVLVATTIIENGIDISNVNTIIIDRADMYGVSQLYQLRGRVGRSDRTAYAYLFYPQDHALSEIAVKRLKTISENTELGSGFKVAMKDMELRGAGNLLGREQSGHMSTVGLDMYIRLLDEEINKLQNKTEETAEDTYFELDYSGFIPDFYISEPSTKFEIYKRIASVTSDVELSSLKASLVDRFGPIPDEVSSLLYIAELKVLCKALRIGHLQDRQGTTTLVFGKMSKLSLSRLLELIRTSSGKVKLDPASPNVLRIQTGMVSLKDKALFLLEKLQRLNT